MDITPLVPRGRQIVQSYGGGGFTIAGVRYRGSTLVFADRTEAWPVSSAAEITPESLAVVTEAEVEILLLGIGTDADPTMALPGVRTSLCEAGVALEILSTGAACRTFNVLLGEDRRPAAALIAVE